MLENEFNIYHFTYSAKGEHNLLKLKEWVDARVAAGEKELELDISWGYYNDIDGLKLISGK